VPGCRSFFLSKGDFPFRRLPKVQTRRNLSVCPSSLGQADTRSPTIWRKHVEYSARIVLGGYIAVESKRVFSAFADRKKKKRLNRVFDAFKVECPDYDSPAELTAKKWRSPKRKRDEDEARPRREQRRRIENA
jgi:hypothetical protein